jgi:hypothetical protein
MPHTAAKLRSRGRRLDKLNTSVANVLAKMRAGERLHLEYDNSGSRWLLSGTGAIPDKVARVVINYPGVEGADITFFGCPAQTYWIQQG